MLHKKTDFVGCLFVHLYENESDKMRCCQIRHSDFTVLKQKIYGRFDVMIICSKAYVSMF